VAGTAQQAPTGPEVTDAVPAPALGEGVVVLVVVVVVWDVVGLDLDLPPHADAPSASTAALTNASKGTGLAIQRMRGRPFSSSIRPVPHGAFAQLPYRSTRRTTERSPISRCSRMPE
jgi:hypothetical protein